MKLSTIDRVYGDTLIVVVPTMHETEIIPRMFVNPYVNSNGIDGHKPVTDVLKAIDVKTSDIKSNRAFSIVYNFFKNVSAAKEGHLNPWWMKAEKGIQDTTSPVPGNQGKRTFNIISVPADTIPKQDWENINTPKILVVDGRSEYYADVIKEFTESVDEVFVHNGMTPNLKQGIDSILSNLGFDV